MDIRNLLRHLQASSNISAIARATGLNRRTILRYRDWAQTHDLLTEPLPSLEHRQHLLATTLPSAPPPQTVSSVEPFRALVEQLYAQGPHLKPLPDTPYDLALWKQLTVHRDCYVVFDNAFYSVPFRLVGQRVWVRGSASVVRVYTSNYELVATHLRAQHPGEKMALSSGEATTHKCKRPGCAVLPAIVQYCRR